MLHRRSALFAGVAFVGSISPFLAQTRSGSSPSGQMRQAEAQHIKDTMKVRSVALATSRLALEKAQNAKVKQFAQFEVAEQQTISDVLSAIESDGKSAARTGQDAGDGRSQPQLDQAGQQMLKRLQEAKAGMEFDREYVSAQIDGHQQLMKIQESYINSGKNVLNLSIAKLARGQIKEHLTLLNDINAQNKRG
jgi:putative membrane protein